MKAFWIALVVAGMVLGAPCWSVAQTASRPPAAEEALMRGFEMAQRERWSLAIRYFGNAQDLAPTDPVILFNLALANDRAKGRDVIAAAWYRAYLEAAPEAANATKVRARVTDLEIEVEAAILDMLETAKAVSVQLTDRARTASMAQIVGAQAASGNIQEAAFGLSSLKTGSQSDWARARVAAAQAKKGDLIAAANTQGTIKQVAARRWAQAEIAVRHAMRSEFALAVRNADAIGESGEQDFAFSRIAVLQARSGDVASAERSAGQISKNAVAETIAAKAEIAAALLRSGQPWLIEKAPAILDEINAQSRAVQDAMSRQVAILQIVRAKAASGDVTASRQDASLLIDPRFKHLAAQAVAEAEGDAKSAGIHRWSAIAHEASASVKIQDLSAFLNQASGRDPVETISMIAATIEQWSHMMDKFREF